MYYAYQRTWKPFNPILGETYEMVNHNGITFLAEQVCLTWVNRMLYVALRGQIHGVINYYIVTEH